MNHTSPWSRPYPYSNGTDDGQFWYSRNTTHLTMGETFDNTSAGITITIMLVLLVALPLLCAVMQRHCCDSKVSAESLPASDGNTVAAEEDDKDLDLVDVELASTPDILIHSVPQSDRSLYDTSNKGSHRERQAATD